MLSWAGVKIGGVIDSAMSTASKMPQKAGDDGGKAAVSGAKTVVTKL